MNDLIEARKIFRKYGKRVEFTPYEHDVYGHEVMTVCGVYPNDVTEEDKKTLEEKGFFVSEEYGDECFKSYKFGSA